MKKHKIVLTALFAASFPNLMAQFAPQAGIAGTTAIHKDSSVFVAWATGCSLNRGWQDISDTTLGKAEVGDETYVPGMAGNGIVSLGDGGEAVVTFTRHIRNGAGFDFAVFENGFIDQTLKPGTAFLELAFVEVSSDGISFFRFPAISNNDSTTQLASFEGIDAATIHNFAGKYIANYGTPFDLEDMKGITGLDVDHITHIRLKDVVGSLSNAYASRDSRGVKVNDPWPTPFSQGGFDLDGIGVINQDETTGVGEYFTASDVIVYPNPATSHGRVQIKLPINQAATAVVYNAFGKQIATHDIQGGSGTLAILPTGIYFLQVAFADTVIIKKIMIQ